MQQMGVEVVESRTSHLEKYTNLITVRFVTDTRTLSVSGTVFGKDAMRITDFFGYPMDFEPTRNVIAVQNEDKPGVIGRIGTFLGENGINIATLNWGRKGTRANAVVGLDGDVPDEVVARIAKLDGVIRASLLHF